MSRAQNDMQVIWRRDEANELCHALNEWRDAGAPVTEVLYAIDRYMTRRLADHEALRRAQEVVK